MQQEEEEEEEEGAISWSSAQPVQRMRSTLVCYPHPLLICPTYNSQHAICVVFWYCTPHLNVSLSPAGVFGALVDQSCAHPGAEKKAGGGESRLVADFSAQPVGWAELTPITLHNLLRQ